MAGITGDLTQGALQKIRQVTGRVNSAISVIDNTVGRVKNLVSAISGEGVYYRRQQEAFLTLETLWRSRAVMSVVTPWRTVDNMTIESITAHQGGVTRGESNFSVNLKELRFAELEFTTYENNLFPARNAVQGEDESDNGLVNGQAEDVGFLETFVDRVAPGAL